MTLSDIQKTLKAPKNQYNDFGKYKYRNCEDILEAVKPLLGTSTLLLTDAIVEAGGRVYVEATVIFNDGKETVCKAYAREPETKKGMDESQITGAASSYARKYALNGLFLIDDTKDADAQGTHAKSEPRNEEPADGEGFDIIDIIANSNLTTERKAQLTSQYNAKPANAKAAFAEFIRGECNA